MFLDRGPMHPIFNAPMKDTDTATLLLAGAIAIVSSLIFVWTFTRFINELEVHHPFTAIEF